MPLFKKRAAGKTPESIIRALESLDSNQVVHVELDTTYVAGKPERDMTMTAWYDWDGKRHGLPRTKPERVQVAWLDRYTELGRNGRPLFDASKIRR